jgi:type IV secretory pathway VirB2 component (pilin)
MKIKKQILIGSLISAIIVLTPAFANAGLEDSLFGLKTRITGVILPLLAVIGIAIGAISFFTGNPRAKEHIVYAILGCVFGFGAQAIVDFISQTVH